MFTPHPYPLYGCVERFDPYQRLIYLVLGWRDNDRVGGGYAFPVLSVDGNTNLTVAELEVMTYSPDPLHWLRRDEAEDVIWGPGVPQPNDFGTPKRPAVRSRRSWDDLREERAAKPKGEYL